PWVPSGTARTTPVCTRSCANPTAAPPPPQVESLQSAARSLGQPLLVVPAGTEAQIDEAFAIMVQRKVAGIVYGATVFFQVVRGKLIALAPKHAIPAIYDSSEFVAPHGTIEHH